MSDATDEARKLCAVACMHEAHALVPGALGTSDDWVPSGCNCDGIVQALAEARAAERERIQQAVTPRLRQDCLRYARNHFVDAVRDIRALLYAIDDDPNPNPGGGS